MFGTIFWARPKPGEEKAVEAVMDRFWKERAPKVKGARASYMLHKTNGEILGFAIFDDEATYRANANDPEQDKWYRELRSHLEADPAWNDGEIRAWSL